MKYSFKKFGLGLTLGLMFIQTGVTFASAASIQISPASNNWVVGNQYTINVRVSGDGQAFDTAGATIATSQNISVNSVTLGDCGFSFIKLPTASNLSFKGAILGGSSEGCTAYSMVVEPRTAGNAAITISNGSVVSASSPSRQIISSVQNGNYIVGQSAKGPTPTSIPLTHVQPTSYPTQPISQTKTLQSHLAQIEQLDANAQPYTLQVTLYDSADQPAQGRSVVLSAATSGTTDKNGNVIFQGIKEGIYAMQVKKDGNTTAEEIINLSSTPNNQAISIKENGVSDTNSHTDQPINSSQKPFLLGIGGLILLVILVATIILLKRRKPTEPAS